MIKRILRNLGITSNYAGYQQAAAAIQLILEDESRLRSVRRDVYERVAEQYDCTAYCVERNLRTVVSRAWQTDKQRLIKVAGFQLPDPPTNAQFLAIVTEYLRHIKI